MDVEAANILRVHPDALAAFIPFFLGSPQFQLASRIIDSRTI